MSMCRYKITYKCSVSKKKDAGTTVGYQLLKSKGKWKNNDWDYKKPSGKRFSDNEIYNNQPSKPLLVSELNFNTNTDTVYTNFINQIKYSSDQLFPNL